MSNRQLLNDSNRSAPDRPQAGRPPIEWPVREVTAQNPRAANLARNHLEQTYRQEGEPNQVAASTEKDLSKTTQQTDSAYTPTAQDQQPYDWQGYHKAWQQYYQQYFHRYYTSWWQQQKEQIKTDAIQQAASTSEINEPNENQKVAQELRQKIRSKIEKQATKVKQSSHFKPIVAAISVASLFLLVNYNQVLVGAVKQYISPGGVVVTPVIVEPNIVNRVGAAPKIIIPKIGVEAPVVYDEPSVAEADYEKALERGVVRLGTTADPGTKGNVVIGGHSSNNVFNPGKYKYVFVNLKQLDVGDIFYLNFKGKRYTYKVTVAKKIISPKDTSVLAQTSQPTVTLFTCDPPGTNINRLIVQASQIDPDPSGAAKNTNQTTVVNQENPLPSVAPSIWDKIFR